MARKKSTTRLAKKRRIVVDDFSKSNGNTNVVDKANAISKQNELPLLESRCLLEKFKKIIQNWQISEREWALLRRTPFGRLIKETLGLQMNIEMVDVLLGFWDEEHCGFLIGGIIIPFTIDDIALITGLPNRGQKVVHRVKHSKHAAEFSCIYLRLSFIERKINDIIRNKDYPYPEADIRFVQQMILYFWGSVMFPRSGPYVPKFMTNYVMNLDSIESYNWAEEIHSFLVKEINAKSKLVKERNLGKGVMPGFINGPCFIINAWFFEHVDFGKGSRPSNPDVRPRMLKWAKGCKFWQRKPFLQRFQKLSVDKVCYRLRPEIKEFELMSLHSLEHIPSYDTLRGDSSLVGSLEKVGHNIRNGFQEMGPKAMEGEKEEHAKKVEKDCASDIESFKQLVLEQHARISVLERKIANLEALFESKGKSEIVGMNSMITGEVCEQVGYGLTETTPLHESCVEGDKGYGLTETTPLHESCVEGDKGCTLEEFISSGKQGCKQHVKKKMLKSTIAKGNLLLKKIRDATEEKASISSMESLEGFERKNTDVLVNVDEYVGLIGHEKKAIVAPMNYAGRELLTENVRQYLDAFCLKPMQRDDIIFFDWNICIQRHSMLEYLQGGYTSEEIIDAYALILLYEQLKISGDNSASFLYVPPMFLGLYRNKLGSYKKFLNVFDKKSLEKVKLLFLPCHISTANHWLLLVCNMKMKKWIGYDSLYDPRHREVAKEQIMLLTEYLHQDCGLDISSWSLDYRRIYPQQEPATLDCGIFVMKFIESMIHFSMIISFRSTDMRLFRPQIAYKILLHC